MSDAKNDGGPAFPHQKDDGSPYWGMSLRDWFAGQALTGLLAGHYRQTLHYNLGEVPAEAFRIADAMLEARK